MSFRSEFRCSNLLFRHDNVEDFYSIKCCGGGIPFIVGWIARVVFTLYAIGSLIFSISFYNYPRWPVYLTNWGLVFSVVYFLYITVFSAYHKYFKTQAHREEISLRDLAPGNIDTESQHMILPMTFKILWFVMDVTLNVCASLTILYWAIVLDPKHFETPTLAYSYINDHGVIVFFLVVEFFFHNIPVRILHFVYPLLILLVYVIVNVVYNFASGYPVYKAMDWENKAGWACVYMVAAIVLVIIVQFLFYGLYRIKLVLKRE